MLVREVMSTSPVTVLRGTTIHAALHALASAGVTSLPVVSTRGQLRGIVSEADLIRDRVPHDRRMHVLQSPSEVIDRHEVVDEVMTTHVVSVGPDTDIVDAVD